MNDEQERLLQRLTRWLEEIGKSREWFAGEIGVSLGTVNGWYSKSSQRPIPRPVAKLIEYLLKNNELGEPKFSFSESVSIQMAMQKADYVSFPEFAHDAVMAETDRILEEEKHLPFEAPGSKVAEEAPDYPGKKPTGGKGK